MSQIVGPPSWDRGDTGGLVSADAVTTRRPRRSPRSVRFHGCGQWHVKGPPLASRVQTIASAHPSRGMSHPRIVAHRNGDWGRTMRDAQYSGTAAAEWFQKRSMHARILSSTTMVMADEIRAGVFAVRRFWSNARSFDWRGPFAEGTVLITYLIEGRGKADDTEISPGAMVVLESGTSSSLEFETPFAVAQLVTSRSRVSTGGFPTATETAWVGTSSFGNFFLASLMAFFDPSMKRADIAFPAQATDTAGLLEHHEFGGLRHATPQHRC